MDTKSWIYALAASSLVATALQKEETAEAVPQKKKESVECYGINVGKGSNGCGLSVAKAELAFKVYPGAYDKTAEMVSKSEKLGDCSGTANGGKDEKYLGWIEKKSKAECFKADGFVYLKDKKGNLQIEDKTGIKK